MAPSPDLLQRLPDELLESIILTLSAPATLAIGATCTRCQKIASENLVWRRHCIQGWTYWEPRHDLPALLARPAAQTKWRDLYISRRKTDARALKTFEALLLTQQLRVQRVEAVARSGYDVKDLLLRLRDETSDEAEDCLARRYWADVALGQIYRVTALEKWERLQKRQMVRLEEVLGAYDLFVLKGRRGDLNDVDKELDRIASTIRSSTPDFESLSTRSKATAIAQYLRQNDLVGNPSQEDYHALRNNFLSHALFHPPHTSLPLQSVAIYCSVARRLGINAKPSNYPTHVHAVIEAPSHLTLDGKVRALTPTSNNPESEIMHMDPWRSSEEVPREQLTLRLSQMGAPESQHATHLGASSNLEIALRTGRNIMHSVQEARDPQQRLRRNLINTLTTPPASNSSNSSEVYEEPDLEAAWYGMLWSMMILGDTTTAGAAGTLHRRRQCLPYLAEHFQSHFPEDLGLVERCIAPMFYNEREFTVLLNMISTARTRDENARAPNPRVKRDVDAEGDGGGEGNGVEKEVKVEYRVGQCFRHKRYGYAGFIIGWDSKCSAGEPWMNQMRVDDLPRGREQPFYNIV